MRIAAPSQTKTEKILKGARGVFMENGFEKTTMEEIARAIPMSKATLYAVFPNKEEILLALIENHCENLHRMLADIASETTSDYLSALQKMITSLVNAVYEESSTVKTPETLMYVSDRVKARSVERFSRMKGLMRGLLDRAVEAGELAENADTSILCEVIMAMLTSYFPPYQRNFSLPQQQRPSRASFDKEIETVLDLLIGGLRNYKRE
jgi:AcrR family transcriptional regulator